MGRGQEITITNDGATILKAVYIDNPAAKVLVGEPQDSALDHAKSSIEYDHACTDWSLAVIRPICLIPWKHVHIVRCSCCALLSGVHAQLSSKIALTTSCLQMTGHIFLRPAGRANT